MMTDRQKVAAVRKIVKAAGYDFWISYNDKNKTYRRIKMMQNGYHHMPSQYDRWETKIKAELRKAGIKTRSAGFETLHRFGYGPYIAFVVKM